MKNILIIGSRSSGKKNDPAELAAATARSGATVRVAYWEEIVFKIATNDVQITVGEQPLFSTPPDLVVAVGWYKNGSKAMYRDVAYSLSLYLQHQGITFWNSEMAKQRSTTKLSCMMQLALEGIAVPRTTFCLDGDSVLARQAYPYIAKAAGASRGQANYLVQNDTDKQQVLQNPNYYLVQPYLKNDHDLRIVCFDGKPRLVLRRSRKPGADTHLNNTSQGGEAVWVELTTLPHDLLTLCSKICIIMGREMAGIDFIPDIQSEVGYSCLEVNAIPQLTSGFDADKKLNAFAEAIAA